MWLLTVHLRLVEKMEVINQKTRPDFADARAWERQMEKEQRLAFDRLLDEMEKGDVTESECEKNGQSADGLDPTCIDPL